jgi:radical SAM superfamily enzyme YgiQ (UPF0313 family)
MSGVHAFDPELNRVGLTLPGLIERHNVIASLPSLGLLTLAGMTPERFDLEYFETADIEASGRLPACDLAAISIPTARAKEAYALARRFRSAGSRTVIGGLHATVLPDEALQYADAVVVGEGELSWPSVLRDLEHDCLRGVYGPDGQQFDLAQAPVPRFDLLRPERYNRLTVQTQRGCPWRCEFCASALVLTGHYKLKPISKVIEEIRALKQIWRRPFVEFADDNTFVNRPHAKALMRALAPEGVRWFTETDVSVGDDDELLGLMRAARCAEVLIGLESPTTAGLDGVELRRNWKRDRLDRYAASIERIQGYGIGVVGCFVLGLDGDTPEVFDAIWNFARHTGLFDVQVTVLTPFPGTPLYARLQQEDRLLDETGWEKATLFDVNFRPRNMSAEQLQQGLVELGRRLYTDELRKERTQAFREHHRRFTQTRDGGKR